MQDAITLRGLVFSRFKTIGDFATGMGWSRNKASRIINSVQQPDSDDIVALTEVLGINNPETFICVFFTPLSTMWTKTRKE